MSDRDGNIWTLLSGLVNQTKVDVVKAHGFEILPPGQGDAEQLHPPYLVGGCRRSEWHHPTGFHICKDWGGGGGTKAHYP